MPRLRRASAAAAFMVGVLCLFGPASVARAESVLWTLTASPLAATTGASTIFTLTATNADPAAALLSSSEIGCVVLDVPANFTTQGAVVTGSNSGGSWHVDSVVGNRVTVHADSGGDRLEYLGWVRFRDGDRAEHGVSRLGRSRLPAAGLLRYRCASWRPSRHRGDRGDRDTDTRSYPNPDAAAHPDTETDVGADPGPHADATPAPTPTLDRHPSDPDPDSHPESCCPDADPTLSTNALRARAGAGTTRSAGGHSSSDTAHLPIHRRRADPVSIWFRWCSRCRAIDPGCRDGER